MSKYSATISPPTCSITWREQATRSDEARASAPSATRQRLAWESSGPVPRFEDDNGRLVLRRSTLISSGVTQW